MGDNADMILEGVLCQECGGYIDNDDWPRAEELACGHPRYCRYCGGDPECNGARKVAEDEGEGKN